MPIPQFKSKEAQIWRENKNQPRKFKPNDSKNRRRLYFKFLIIPALLLISSGIFFVAWLSSGLPDPNKLLSRDIAQSTKIYDRTGETVLYDIHGEEQRTLVDLDTIPVYVKQATIAIEDKNFYKHRGISVWGILRGVVWQKIRGKRIQGGSTLTQQFVKNAILTSDRTLTRKVKEWVLAYRLEKKYSKDEILQLYFNEIPYGSTAYGIEAAAQKYFGKNAKDLSLAEAAILAALPQAPSTYSPYGSHKDLLFNRQKYILSQMAEQGYISSEVAEQAKSAPIEFKKSADNIIAPHFVMYVKEYLSDKYGEKTVESGGLKIITTLDLYKQTAAEETVTEVTEKYIDKYKASNAALVSLDPKTGQILAMVGSRDYFNDDIDGQVNITTSARQPGSSIKPLVYASLFTKGYTTNTILYDVNTNFSNDEAKPYEPHNYDGGERGPISVRKALAGSLNIPAVKALYLTGVEDILQLAQELGYTTLKDKDRFGLSLVLGGGEVKLIEHTNAFSVFAREGEISPVSSILRVEDKNGNVLEEFKPSSKKVLDAKISRMINSILSDNNARAFIFSANNWLTLKNRPVAAKSGTTNDNRDAWTVGYTPSLVTGVWVGNNDFSQMKQGADGSIVAAPIWNKYMTRVLGNTPVETFKPDDSPPTGKAILDGAVPGKKIIKIDTVSGLLATDFTPPETIKEIELPEHHDILYYINRLDPLGDPPKNASSDPQFNLWESRVQLWAEKQLASTTAHLNLPSETDPLHTAENQPRIKIISPENNFTPAGSHIEVHIDTSAPRGIKKVSYSLNDNLLEETTIPPYNLNANLDFLTNGDYRLKATVCDDVNNCAKDEILINLVANTSGHNTAVSPTLTWLSPAGSTALNSIDFPLNLTVKAEPIKQIASVKYYLSSTGNTNSKQIGAVFSPKTPDVVYSWDGALIGSSSSYSIYAEAITWQNEKLKTNPITITISQ